MGRHGLYEADGIEDILQYGRWRGAVASAIRGRHGQEFLRELLRALDALPLPRLIAEDLENAHGEVCALGAVGRARCLDMNVIDVEDYEQVARAFEVTEKLAQEIMWINDEHGPRSNSVPAMEQRFAVVRDWVLRQIRSKGELVPALKAAANPAKE